MIVNLFESNLTITKVIDDLVNKSSYMTKPKYIIMNGKTFYDIKPSKDIQLNIDNYYSNEEVEKEEIYATVRGIPIAICEKLKNGEIDII